MKGFTISDAEWRIMKVLWEKQKLTLKDITGELRDSEWSYTTVRTLVTRLMEKGAISADKTAANNFKYFAAVSENDCKKKAVNSLLNKVFDGSVSMLVSTLTKDSNLSKEEQKELLSIIEKIEDNER